VEEVEHPTSMLVNQVAPVEAVVKILVPKEELLTQQVLVRNRRVVHLVQIMVIQGV
jgi:hypothetical protein